MKVERATVVHVMVCGMRGVVSHPYCPDLVQSHRDVQINGENTSEGTSVGTTVLNTISIARLRALAKGKRSGSRNKVRYVLTLRTSPP